MASAPDSTTHVEWAGLLVLSDVPENCATQSVLTMRAVAEGVDYKWLKGGLNVPEEFEYEVSYYNEYAINLRVNQAVVADGTLVPIKTDNCI
jgi:hypothetical protein